MQVKTSGIQLFIVRSRMDSSVFLASTYVPFPVGQDNILIYFWGVDLCICCYGDTMKRFRLGKAKKSIKISVSKSLLLYSTEGQE